MAAHGAVVAQVCSPAQKLPHAMGTAKKKKKKERKEKGAFLYKVKFAIFFSCGSYSLCPSKEIFA